MVISGNRGREYKPRFNRIVLFFKNIDLCGTDEWGTCEIVELILQLIRRNGFYSDTLEWISVSGVDICCSMSDVPKQRLSPRYVSIAQNFYTEFPSDIELHLIIKNQFWSICSRFKRTASRKQIDQIVDALIEMYSNVSHSLYSMRRGSAQMITISFLFLRRSKRHLPETNEITTCSHRKCCPVWSKD